MGTAPRRRGGPLATARRYLSPCDACFSEREASRLPTQTSTAAHDECEGAGTLPSLAAPRLSGPEIVAGLAGAALL